MNKLESVSEVRNEGSEQVVWQVSSLEADTEASGDFEGCRSEPPKVDPELKGSFC